MSGKELLVAMRRHGFDTTYDYLRQQIGPLVRWGLVKREPGRGYYVTTLPNL